MRSFVHVAYMHYMDDISKAIKKLRDIEKTYIGIRITEIIARQSKFQAFFSVLEPTSGSFFFSDLEPTIGFF